MRGNAVRAEKRETDRKRQKYLKWISSFAVTTAVAVAAVVSPSLPEASFLRLSAFGDSVVFETRVTDPDFSLDEDSLWIRMEGSGETWEAPLEVGTDSGWFSGLSPGREYTVQIFAEGTWGEQKIAEETVLGSPDPGGGILGWELLPGTGDPWDPLGYRVETRICDPDGEYSGIRLEYALGQEEGSVPASGNWSEVPPGDTAGTYLLEGIPDENLIVWLRLSAEGPSGPEILDQVGFRTPVRFLASLYVTGATADSLTFSFWGDSVSAIPAVYRFTLYEGEAEVDSRILESDPDDSGEWEGTRFTVSGLSSGTIYRMALEAEYTDPDTGRPEVLTVAEEDVAAPPAWSAVLTGTPEGAGWHYVLDVWDPGGIFSADLWYTLVYPDGTDGQTVWFDSGSLSLAEGPENHYIAEFDSGTPPSASWTLTVSGTMTPAEGIEYSWVTLAEAGFPGE